ncbi:MAG: tripartite tricarboxylate transporter TctB family protein, partial [Frankiales bacterium]|nr:tripartite tricarboxylate transporter TctB family protein [Frankiales bacterium]
MTGTGVSTAYAPTSTRPARTSRLAGRSELGLAALLLALGVFVLAETATIKVPENANSIGPRFFPSVVGALLCLVASWLVVDVLRGGHGDM